MAPPLEDCYWRWVDVLIADPEPALYQQLQGALAKSGVELTQVVDDNAALLALKKKVFHAVVLDENLPTMGAQELTACILERWPDCHVVLATSDMSVSATVAAVRAGMMDVVSKPYQVQELVLAVEKAAAQGPQEEEPPPPSACLQTQLVGSSDVVETVLIRVAKVAIGNSTVLIRGESGTGKELLARRIHELSPRRRGPFVKVNAAALPDQLLESELFGYEKGAFTGAQTRKPGRLELAEGGTLFLDEIGDISGATQVKLLRVLQEKEYESLGGTKTRKANVRFVAATHKPLEKMVAEGTFREDLYYRLNVVPIEAPALRERPGDIPALIEHFTALVCQENARSQIRFEAGAVELAAAYAWPGNVRQLQNFVERLVVLSDTQRIGAGAVRHELSSLRAMDRRSASPTTAVGGSLARQVGELSLGVTALELDEAVRRAEHKALHRALTKAKGNRTLAARILGVSRRTLYNKLAEHGIE